MIILTLYFSIITSDDSLGYDFPFTLRAVVDGGRNCALCPWTRFCRGCEVPCNDEPLLQGIVLSEQPSSKTVISIILFV